MTNKNDIVFADGSVIKAGNLEFIGSRYTAHGETVYEFRETGKKDCPYRSSSLLEQFGKEKEDV